MLQNKTRIESIESAVLDVLEAVGEDPTREGLVGTPSRVARMYGELLSGYNVDPTELLNGALFDVEHEQMVIVTNIEFQSLCEHHMLPFYGRAHVAYVPDKHIVGISKLARLVECYARRLQVQERMTSQIAGFIQRKLKPLGVGVVIRAEHMCMRMRGVQKPNSSVVTSSLLGVFQERDTRQEFMNLLS